MVDIHGIMQLLIIGTRQFAYSYDMMHDDSLWIHVIFILWKHWFQLNGENQSSMILPISEGLK